jgi:hypothetical protein
VERPFAPKSLPDPDENKPTERKDLQHEIANEGMYLIVGKDGLELWRVEEDGKNVFTGMVFSNVEAAHSYVLKRIGRLSPCAMMGHCGFIMAHGRELKAYRKLLIDRSDFRGMRIGSTLSATGARVLNCLFPWCLSVPDALRAVSISGEVRRRKWHK